jgi:hypothetical protein
MLAWNITLNATTLLVLPTLLWIPCRLSAGEHVRVPSHPQTTVSNAIQTVAQASRQGTTVTLMIPNETTPAQQKLHVDLLGPDGKSRRFPVEGGRSAIQYQRIVLHPGESLALHLQIGQ